MLTLLFWTTHLLQTVTVTIYIHPSIHHNINQTLAKFIISMNSNNNNNTNHIDPASRLLSTQYAILSTPQLTNLRRENLRNLFTALDEADRFFVRNLSRLTFPQVPPEVVSRIMRLLPLQDVLNCARVSRSWRSAVCSQSVSANLLTYHFPGVTTPQPQDSTLWDFFRKKAMASNRRVEGRYISYLPVSMFEPAASPFVVDPPGYDERLRAEDPSIRRDEMRRRKSGLQNRYLYNNGRFAWHIDNDHVFVDDLRATPMTRTLVQPSGDNVLTGDLRLEICLMTENLLVFLDRKGGRKVYASAARLQHAMPSARS